MIRILPSPWMALDCLPCTGSGAPSPIQRAHPIELQPKGPLRHFPVPMGCGGRCLGGVAVQQLWPRLAGSQKLRLSCGAGVHSGRHLQDADHRGQGCREHCRARRAAPAACQQRGCPLRCQGGPSHNALLPALLHMFILLQRPSATNFSPAAIKQWY